MENQLQHSTGNKKIEELKRKPRHGKFYWQLERLSVANEKSMMWVCSSGLKGEMGGLMVAAQDQALSMQYHQRYIMKQPIVSNCRMCYKAEEPMKHIVVECTTLAPSEYSNRCSKVAGYIHGTIGKHVGLQVTDKY